MARKIAAITFIYICSVVAWVFLGATVQLRTEKQDRDLRVEVGQLWGTIQQQRAPVAYYQTKETVKVKETTNEEVRKVVEKTETRVTNHYLSLESSDILVDLYLDQRKKGLLWYSTYKVGFNGKYKVVNTTDEERDVYFSFSLPSQGSVYDNFHVMVNGKEVESIDTSTGSVIQGLHLQPKQEATYEISYKTQGMDDWWYMFGDTVTQVRNFNLTMTTDFDKIDFPQNSVSSTKREKINGGWKLNWQYTNLLSGVQIGMTMPKKLNPGPWAAKITYFAPVSLFLFFFLTMVFSTLKNVKIHPMNYFFLASAFFAYHLLLAYLVDHVSIHLAFWICSAVSIFLVVSYMRIVVGQGFAFKEIGLSQLVFLVFFSYSFFFEGFTGLTVTILCIVTLFIIMQMTARLDWETVFRDGNAKKPEQDLTKM